MAMAMDRLSRPETAATRRLAAAFSVMARMAAGFAGRWRRGRKNPHTFRRLPDYVLRDIGVNRTEINAGVRQFGIVSPDRDAGRMLKRRDASR